MFKKILTIILTLAILFVFVAPAFPRWGPKPQGFGPVVLGHPWGEYPRSEPSDTPVCYRSGAGFQDLIITGTISFTVQFYLKYVVKKKADGQISIKNYGKSD
ncbi:MAG: hypothetical protein WBF13_04805 [Candidatus Zixiibacteriota bacterium]